MNPLDNYTCVEYTPEAEQSERLLSHYLETTEVKNNQTKKQLRVDMYDRKNGVLFFLVNKHHDTVDGITSCVRYNENNIISAKTWHRLHLKPGVPRAVIDKYFEPATFKWCAQNKIENLWVTFNETTPRICAWAAARMGVRGNMNKKNPYSDYGLTIRKGWRPYHKLIFERYVWQYVIYYSPRHQFFLSREEKDLDSYMRGIFRQEFPDATSEWLR